MLNYRRSILFLLLSGLQVFFFFCYSQNSITELLKTSKLLINEGKYDSSLAVNLRALQLSEATANYPLIAYSNIQVGNAHYYLKQKTTAIKWYRAALQIIIEHKIDSLLTTAYHNISVMYNETGQLDSTLYYANKAISILKKTTKYAELSKVLAALSDVYINKQRDIKEAERIIDEAQKYAILSGDRNSLAFVAMKQSLLNGRKQNYKLALNYLNEVEKIYKETGAPDKLLYVYTVKTLWLIKSRDTLAAEYLFLLNRLKDSLFKSESASKMAKYDVMFQTQKKERENMILQQQNKLNNLQLKSRNRTIFSLIAGALLIVSVLLWRLNYIRLKRQKQEIIHTQKIQLEKERISRDLHDNVGGQLSYVLFSIDGLVNEDKNKRTEVSNAISESIRNVILNLRETIWAINGESMSIYDLSDKLKVYARSLFKHTETKIQFSEVFKSEKKLDSVAGLSLYRACQEILNNAFKYARASHVKIEITCDQELSILITDNGVGFDKYNPGKETYGIKNIYQRVKELDGKVELNTESGKGTVYKIIV